MSYFKPLEKSKYEGVCLGMHLIKIICFIVLYVVSCAFTISYSVWGNTDSMIIMGLSLSQWSFFLPSLLIFLFGIRAYIKGWKNFSKISYASNELYLLGYMGTIVSIVTLVFIISFGKIPLENSFDLIARSLCLALTTSLTGLIGMFVLKLVLHNLNSSESTSVAGKIQDDIHPETMAIKKNLGGLASEIHETTAVMSNLKKQTGDLFGMMGEMPKSLEPLNKKILELTNHFEKMHKTFSIVSNFKLPRKVIQSMENGFVGIEKVYKSFLDFNTTLEKVNSSSERIMDVELKGLKGSFHETANVLVEFKKGVENIDSVLTDFAGLQKKGITNEKEFSEKHMKVLTLLLEELGKLVKTLNEMTPQLDAQGRGSNRPVLGISPSCTV